MYGVIKYWRCGIPIKYNMFNVYKTTSDLDTLYHHQAMKQPDKAKFKKAMLHKEILDDRMRDNNNFSVIPKSELPQGAMVLPAVWQLRQK